MATEDAVAAIADVGTDTEAATTTTRPMTALGLRAVAIRQALAQC